MFQKECSGAVLIQFRRHFWRVTARLVFQVSTEKSYRGTRKKFFITFSVLARTMTLLAKCLLRKQIWAVRCSQALSYMNHEISPKRVQRSVYCHKFMQNVKLLYNSMCLASGKWFNLLRKLVDRVLQNSIELYRELYRTGLQKIVFIELYRKCYRMGLEKIISIELYRIDSLFVIIFIS